MTDASRRTFRVEGGARLDVAIVQHLSMIPGLTRARVRGWVEQGLVRVNGQPVKPARRLAPGDEVEVVLPPPPPRRELAPREMPLSVVYEDEWLLALDKPPGLVVHPAQGNWEGTLMHGLLWRAEGYTPHLVSRLDQGTSGLILVAKAPEVHAALQRTGMEKDYLAVVYGRTGLPKGRIDLGILRDPADPRRRMASRTEGRPSTTLWERLAQSENTEFSLLRCRLLTGRTHQIRVHLQAARMPIVGDPLYGAPGWKGIGDPALAEICREFPRQALHAWRLGLIHPVTCEPLEVRAPVPPDLADLLSRAGLTFP
ncbi:MAG TPA: RluA family pseudouridine synthase [Thermoanaerobaculia bacterium]|nr:RluA family pseudouridine synthase [Thermoanaerobaculia bacterium]